MTGMDIGVDALFDMPEEQRGGPSLSPDVRRTRRQHDAVARGVHPLGLLLGPSVRMHPDADRDASPADGRNLPLRCGSCRHRVRRAGHQRTYPKCNQYEMTASAASDVRAWWPACTNYSPADPTVSPDAARWIPQLQEEQQ